MAYLVVHVNSNSWQQVTIFVYPTTRIVRASGRTGITSNLKDVYDYVSINRLEMIVQSKAAFYAIRIRLLKMGFSD